MVIEANYIINIGSGSGERSMEFKGIRDANEAEAQEIFGKIDGAQEVTVTKGESGKADTTGYQVDGDSKICFVREKQFNQAFRDFLGIKGSGFLIFRNAEDKYVKVSETKIPEPILEKLGIDIDPVAAYRERLMQDGEYGRPAPSRDFDEGRPVGERISRF